MITSDRQLKVSKEKLVELKKSLEGSPATKINPILAKSGKVQAQALIQEIENEIAFYENLKLKGVAAIKLNSITDILNLPVMYRVAKGMSQEQFARLVEVGLRQIARYESEGYENINGENFKKILSKINLKLEVGEKVAGE
jgi:HTH-type transcriptional regulator/antitoxin HigA